MNVMDDWKPETKPAVKLETPSETFVSCLSLSEMSRDLEVRSWTSVYCNCRFKCHVTVSTILANLNPIAMTGSRGYTGRSDPKQVILYGPQCTNYGVGQLDQMLSGCLVQVAKLTVSKLWTQ